MNNFGEYPNFDATELARLIRNKEISRTDVIEAAISAVKEINPRINAVVLEMFDQALEESNEVEDGAAFSGVPYLLKDMGPSYKGVPTRMGSRLFNEDSIPKHDSHLTQQFRRAGLVPIGKSSTPELALSVATESVLHGPTRNPWDLGRSAGGSSGGAAAAVAAGVVPIAHGNDGAGSIRMPASACGVVGFKPSRGRVSWAPEFGECWEGLATNHVLTRSVRDSAIALDLIAGAAPGDPYFYSPPATTFAQEIGEPTQKLTIGYSLKAPPGAGPVDEDCEKAVLKAVEYCRALGHIVKESSPEVGVEEMIDPMMTLMEVNCSVGINARLKYLGRELRDDDVEKTIRILWEKGLQKSGEDYAGAVAKMHLIGRRLGHFFRSCDLWMSPVLSSPPVPLGKFSLDSMDYEGYLEMLRSYMPHTMLFNLTGGPGISLPLHWSANGLPVGVQIAADIGNDAVVLKLAAQIENAYPWRAHRPPVYFGSQSD